MPDGTEDRGSRGSSHTPLTKGTKPNSGQHKILIDPSSCGAHTNSNDLWTCTLFSSIQPWSRLRKKIFRRRKCNVFQCAKECGLSLSTQVPKVVVTRSVPVFVNKVIMESNDVRSVLIRRKATKPAKLDIRCVPNARIPATRRQWWAAWRRFWT